jgi:hypothetical protein
MAVPPVNASAVVTPATIAKTTFIVGSPSPVGTPAAYAESVTSAARNVL